MTIFTSDNAAGIHPEVLEAIARANAERAIAYGDDPWTARAIATLRAHFGARAEVLLVWGGTAANVIALRAVTDSYDAVLCAETSHLACDECAAPERFLGGKLLPIPAVAGKLTPDAVATRIRGEGVVHHAQPRVLSIAQPTELGTVYTLDETRALAELAHARGLLLHVDGARLPNAAAHLGVSLAALTTEAGVDLVSCGGTKHGLLGAEAVVLIEPAHARGAAFHQKQGMQLASKMRFLAVQLDALFAGDLWLRGARAANAAARRLAEGVRRVPHVELAYPVETNAVFAHLPASAADALRAAGFRFLTWAPHPERPLVRWMTAFDTRDDEIERFIAALHATAGG